MRVMSVATNQTPKTLCYAWGISHLEGSSSPPSIDARRKLFVTLTVAMIISSSVGGLRSMSLSK